MPSPKEGCILNNLIYTVSDLSPKSLDCSFLLRDSLLSHSSNFDFLIFTNNEIRCDKECILVEKELIDLNIVASKYTSNLPSGYSNYLYLDSDILACDSFENLIKIDKINILEELNNIGDNQWHKPIFCPDEEKDYIYSRKALNAGSFSFTNTDFIKNVKDCILQYKDRNNVLFAMFEQSCFNYSFYKNGYKDYNVLTNVKLFSNRDTKMTEDKTLYHFCGYSGSMTEKYKDIRSFADENF